jgi:hypothetical protein
VVHRQGARREQRGASGFTLYTVAEVVGHPKGEPGLSMTSKYAEKETLEVKPAAVKALKLPTGTRGGRVGEEIKMSKGTVVCDAGPTDPWTACYGSEQARKREIEEEASQPVYIGGTDRPREAWPVATKAMADGALEPFGLARREDIIGSPVPDGNIPTKATESILRYRHVLVGRPRGQARRL